MTKLTYEQALAKLYTKAEADLIKTIRRKTAHGNATAYERSLLRQVDEQIKALQKSSDRLVQKLIRSNYKKGLDKLVSDLSADNTAPGAYSLMSRLNSNQINIIVDNLTQHLNMAASTVGRRCDDMIRQVTLEAMAKKLTQGKTVREMQKELEKRLENQNITSVTYSNGAEHNIKDYAAMAVRTATAETQNTAQLVQGKEWGYDLVRMTSHYPTCEVCAMYQGRVYAVTKEAANGKYKDKDGNPLRFSYLYDTVLTEGYDTVHPNCRHRFSIFSPRAYTLDELAEFSRQSTQPFADTRSDAERKAYAKEQAVKRKRNASRRQYEKIKSCFPNDAPKTFASWQKMKSANSQKYRDLLEDYRIIRKTIAEQEKNDTIKLKDSNSYGKEITESSIKNVPKMNVFADENLNNRYQQANKDLLARAKEENTGIEISAVYNEKMEQIGGYTVGKEGNVTIENPGINYHGFHNHPSGETFSVEDILRFCDNSKMLSITAIGNNANCYCFSSNNNCDKEGYKSFLADKLKEPLFGNYCYKEIKDFDIVGTEMEEDLKNILIQFTEDCIEGGKNYGFKYIFTRLADR